MEVMQIEVWVVFEGSFFDVDMCSVWDWNFYGIYNSEVKANEVIASLKAKLDGNDEIKYKVEKHSVQ